MCFNSIKVRLKQDQDDATEHKLSSFNSIKVRLKPQFWHREAPDAVVSIP